MFVNDTVDAAVSVLQVMGEDVENAFNFELIAVITSTPPRNNIPFKTALPSTCISFKTIKSCPFILPSVIKSPVIALPVF